MKPQIKLNICVFFLYASYVGFSQTSITNKDYEVTDDVVKIEEIKYKQILLSEIDKPEIYSSSESHFFNNLIQSSKYSYDNSKEISHEIYKYSNALEYSIDYYSLENGIKKNESTFAHKILNFNGLTIDLPTIALNISESTPTKLKLSYKRSGNVYNHFYLFYNNTIEEEVVTDYMDNKIINTYNSKGVKIKEFFSPNFGYNIKYDKDGLITEKEMYPSPWLNNATYFFYKKDKKGNWFKKIEIEKHPNIQEKITYSARKLTYSNGEVTGSTNFDKTFVTWELVYFGQDLKDKSTSKLGCISGDCQNGSGKFTFNNGDIYEGDFKSGNINGQGKFTFADGDVYEGSFKINERSGFGTYTYTSGNKYVGNWENNQQNGKGIFTFANGVVYEGNFNASLREGFGTYTFANRNKYEGNWEKGLKHGKGILYDFIAGKKQEAIYKEGKVIKVLNTTDINENNHQTTSTTALNNCISGNCQNGFGKMKYPNNDVYEGLFVNGIRNGQANYKYSNGDNYYGTFEKGSQNGTGLFLFKSGDVYEGNYKNGLRNGFGTYLFSNGNYYFGNWVNGKLEGEVTYFEKKDNKQYQQVFKNGTVSQTLSTKNTAIKEENSECIVGDCKNGFSILFSSQADGDYMFVGNFKNEMLYGYAKSYINNKLTYEGEYSNNKYNGTGTLYSGDYNEIKYIGSFKDGLMHGPSKMYKNEQILFEGNYENNFIEGEGTYYNHETNKKTTSIFKKSDQIRVVSSTAISSNNTQTNTSSIKIPNGLVWNKNSENTEVWLYENGVEIEGTVFFVDATLYFYETKNDNIYTLENFNAQTSNSYHNTIALPNKYPQGAFIKRSATGFIAINAKGEIIKSSEVLKFAPNGGGIIYKGTNETETLLFKDFANVELNKVYPAEIYNATIQTTQTTNNSKISNFQKEIDECKSEKASCLANKITDKYTSLKNEGISDESIYTKLSEDFNSICAYSSKAMFEVIFNLNTSILPQEKYSKIVAKMSAEQKENLKAYSKKLTEDYMKTHTNEVPESLKGSVKKQ